ncbi:MAG: prephenate dehydrogenase [Oscillospiraceae bacterium]|nr:prephenate dehydrogenase [Oscillospiraceae bacterium]
MTVGIIGLGLIGGSLAKAYKAAGWTVLVHDTDDSIREFAIMSGAADRQLTVDNERLAVDLILIAVYPAVAIKFLEEYAEYIRPDTIVIDCCGTKKNICEAGFALAEKHRFTFVGGHPMAGIEKSGFKHSAGDLFVGATMVIVPPVYDDIDFLQKIKEMLTPCGFGRITVTTAEKHDEVIAFTSQMPHLVSNSFIKSPTGKEFDGFSAGSYKDLTRVAWLNENMWTELFMENRGFLLNELNTFITSLEEYRAALQSGDYEGMRSLLYDGKKLKEEIG